jgi:hypothetical protein
LPDELQRRSRSARPIGVTTISIPLYKYSQHFARWKVIFFKGNNCPAKGHLHLTLLRQNVKCQRRPQKTVCICMQTGADFKPPAASPLYLCTQFPFIKEWIDIFSICLYIVSGNESARVVPWPVSRQEAEGMQKQRKGRARRTQCGVPGTPKCPAQDVQHPKSSIFLKRIA